MCLKYFMSNSVDMLSILLSNQICYEKNSEYNTIRREFFPMLSWSRISPNGPDSNPVFRETSRLRLRSCVHCHHVCLCDHRKQNQYIELKMTRKTILLLPDRMWQN